MSDPTPDNDPATSERPPGLEDLTDFDVAWPTSTDTLTPSTSTTGARASIESAYGGDYRRAEGFRKAAMVLADRLSHGQRDDEVLVYPFVYCWRHHLELLLKQLITDSAALYGDSLPADLNSTHSIGALWTRAKPYIQKTFPDDPTSDTKIPDRIVGQLAQIDPHGMTLRYARTPSGKPTGGKTPIWVEIERFSTALLNFSMYLEGAIMGTSYYADAQPDDDWRRADATRA